MKLALQLQTSMTQTHFQEGQNVSRASVHDRVSDKPGPGASEIRLGHWRK